MLVSLILQLKLKISGSKLAITYLHNAVLALNDKIVRQYNGNDGQYFLLSSEQLTVNLLHKNISYHKKKTVLRCSDLLCRFYNGTMKYLLVAIL